MGNVPHCRVTEYLPLTNTGLDYSERVMIMDKKLRNAKLLKCYLCFFIRIFTKCIHLELVSDFTSEKFLACLKRFVSRRENLSNLYSDRSTTFKGDNNTEIMKFLNLNQVLLVIILQIWVFLGTLYHHEPPVLEEFNHWIQPIGGI